MGGVSGWKWGKGGGQNWKNPPYIRSPIRLDGTTGSINVSQVETRTNGAQFNRLKEQYNYFLIPSKFDMVAKNSVWEKVAMETLCLFYK